MIERPLSGLFAQMGQISLADILNKDMATKNESQEEERPRCYLDTSMPLSYTLAVSTSKSIKSTRMPVILSEKPCQSKGSDKEW